MFSPLHLSSLDTQKIFQNIFLSAQWIVIPARMVVACSLERRWIAEGTRHRPERQNSYHGIKLKIIDSFAWIEPVAHLSQHKVCARVKWVSLHDYHVVCSIHTSEHSVNIRTNSAFEKFNNCHFTIIMSCVDVEFGKFGFRKKSAFG